MKKILYLLPLLFMLLACGAQAAPTQDVSNMVNATLTAIAQNSPQAPFTQTLIPVDNSSALWKTYRNDVYGFTFEYPAIYDEAAYSDTCGIKPSDAGIHLGHQIDLFFLNANGQDLTQFADNLIQTKGWSIDSQTHDPINGLEAAAIQYRFGGTNRFGTFTLVKQGEQIFAFNFSAGGFCEVPTDQPAESAAYSHMIETFQLNK